MAVTEAAAAAAAATEADAVDAEAAVAAVAAAAIEAAPTAGNDYLHRGPPPLVGGRLSQFAEEWSRVTSDQWVLDTVKFGYRLEFTGHPPQSSTRRQTTVPDDPEQKLALLGEIQQLEAKAAIRRVQDHEIHFSSTFFLVPKKGGTWRPILNLKPLNRFIRPPHFRMESLQAILPELETGWWAASLDLRDAYLHVPMHHSSRKWLGFYVNQVPYQFTCLPFGLSTAPRTFTRVVKVVAESLRRRGHRIFVYLDDWLLVAPSRPQLLLTIATTRELIQRLGLIENTKKSQLTPVQQIEFLGARLDFQQGRVFPTLERVNTVVSCAESLLQKRKPPASLWMRFLGLAASLVAMLPFCRMHMRVVQLHVLWEFNIRVQPLSTEIPKSISVCRALRWWTVPRNFLPGCPFTSRASSCTLTTDASKTGWGGHFRDIQMSGLWTTNVAKNHINTLELWAVHLALRRIRHLVKGHKVTVECDNMTVVSYLNRQGGTKSRTLCTQTLQVLRWCQRHDIEILAVHLPGEDNTLADALSRKATGVSGPSKVRGSSVEWHLLPSICQLIFQRMERPLVDLFANKLNAQLPTYCSWNKDPAALHQDAMSMSWENISAYAFPPIALIPRVLRKLMQTRSCRMILVCPKWPKQPWFPRLLSLLSGTPRILPVRKDLVSILGTRLPEPSIEAIALTAWPLSSNQREQQDFQNKLQNCLQRQGEVQPDKLMISVLDPTLNGAVRTKWIICRPL